VGAGDPRHLRPALDDGDDLTGGQALSERRRLLEDLDLRGPTWTTADTFDDGPTLFTAVCGLGFKEVVAKKLTSRYRPNDRAWIKVKNPNYWRRDADERPCAGSTSVACELAK